MASKIHVTLHTKEGDVLVGTEDVALIIRSSGDIAFYLSEQLKTLKSKPKLVLAAMAIINAITKVEQEGSAKLINDLINDLEKDVENGTDIFSEMI